jgi:protein pelota
MHESGRRLEDLTGIAAILTYAIEDLDEEVGGDEEVAEEHVPNGRNFVPDEDIDF